MDTDTPARTCLLRGTADEVLATCGDLRAAFLTGGPPPPGLADVLADVSDGLAEPRGGATVALLHFCFDVLMYVPPGLRTPGHGPAAAILAGLDGLAPRLLALREAGDPQIAAWAWHLLSWLPTPVAGLADDALAALAVQPSASARVTLALAAASTAEGRDRTTTLLTRQLDGAPDERAVAAMVLSLLHGDPQRPEQLSDAAVDALVALAERGHWDAWDASPSREFGFHGDLAANLVRAGYARAERTLPALLALVRVSPPGALESVLDHLLRAFFHAHPYDGDARLDALSPLQVRTLHALLADPRVWAPRPRFHLTLRELGLPLGRAPLAAFLGVEAPPVDLTVRGIGPHGALVVESGQSPLDLVRSLLADA